MKAQLVRHVKVVDELGNIVEVKMWKLADPTADRPHGYKYSLVYVVNGERVIGYDNAEGRGDHRHFGKTERSYKFTSLKKLAEDFYDDVEKFKRGESL
jgi:predicted transcriptional regulator